jgi:hypothetical protein
MTSPKQKASAYVYVISRIHKAPTPNITEIPNLGVHRTLKRGLSHYKAVYEDRRSRITSSYGEQDKVVTDHPCTVLAEFYTSDQENVRFERWTVY